MPSKSVSSIFKFLQIPVGLFLMALTAGAGHAGTDIHVTLVPPTAQTRFAKNDLITALNASDDSSASNITKIKSVVLKVDPAAVGAGFQIKFTSVDSPSVPSSWGCIITGSDANETMYGGLELAEMIAAQKPIEFDQIIQRHPAIDRRGIKFNIPLDARTPSYDDSGDAAQSNIAEMWEFDFWQETFDQMARNRYNVLTLWNPHPFPSMIKLDSYPEVALDDVCVTTLKPGGRENEWGEPQLVSTNVIDNLKTVKKMTIDQKIQFWRSVIDHAHSRGIDIYFYTWNICPNSVAAPVAPMYRTFGINIEKEPAGKYGVSHQINDPDTIAYYRAAVKQFLLTYPQVKGIGVTAGEHMPRDWTQSNREQWLYDTYGKGIADAKQLQPDRKIDFIHRVWHTDLTEIMKVWKNYPDRFELSFKYAKARLYSSPYIPFAAKQIKLMKPHGLKSWWNLRNDDIYVHRWGDPDYVREFLKNLPPPAHTAGIHIGSDGYVWGREFASKFPTSPRTRAYEKHWYRTLLWGRLAYDPTLEKSFFTTKLKQRFFADLPRNTGDQRSDQLYRAWQISSKIIPLVNQFHWKDWDHLWSVESCRGHTEGYYEVDTFANHRTMAGSNLQTISDFVQQTIAGNNNSPQTPLAVADQLDGLGHDAEQLVSTIATAQNILNDGGTGQVNVTGLDSELSATLSDMLSMVWLGRYYAAKIRAATNLALFDATGDPKHYASAKTHIQKAFLHCKRYTAQASQQYHSQMLARSGPLDWDQILADSRRDIEIVEEHFQTRQSSDDGPASPPQQKSLR